MIIDNNVLTYLSKYFLKPEGIITSTLSISIFTKIKTLGFNFNDSEENDLLRAVITSLENRVALINPFAV